MITLATWLTLSRMVLVLPAAGLIISDQHLFAAVVLVVAGITDFLDGYVARKRNEVSPIGTALDPIADKVVIIGGLLALTADQAFPGLHIWAVILIIFREVLISGLRESTAGEISLPVSSLAKVKTTSQFAALLALLVAPGAIGFTALWAALILTLWTGTNYIRHWVRAIGK